MAMTDEGRPGPLARLRDWLTDDGAGYGRPLGGSGSQHRGMLPRETAPGEVRAKGTERAARGGLIASAARLAGDTARSRNEAALGSAGKVRPWQEEAWELLDIIGEQRFLAHTLAGRMSQAALYVGHLTPEDSPGSRPEKVNDTALHDLLMSIGDGEAGQSQLVYRFGVNAFVAGEAWLVGIPPRLVPGTPEYESARERASAGLVSRLSPVEALEDEDDVLQLVWRMLSVSEIELASDGETVKVRLETGQTVEGRVEEFYLIRIWRSHPRRAWEADSPTRASLPVLRELFGLSQHVSAQIDSRLAGAGLLAVSGEVEAALKRAEGIPEDDPRSPLMEALTLAMQTPIGDRSSAAAIVPLTVNVPPGVNPAEAFHHLSFSSPLDKEARQLRDEAIRRLALGQDAPPELLLGTGGMNHWGAWLVREDVVTTHLEPPLALLCDALTTQYLRPLMIQLGYSEEQVDQYVVWYDVDHLVARPNRTEDAKALFQLGAISEKSLREAVGFEENDAPVSRGESDPAVDIVLRMAQQAPSLVQAPGLVTLLEQVREVLGTSQPSADDEAPAEAAPGSTEGGPPATDPADPPPPGTPGGA